MCGVGLSRSANRSCGPGSQVPILENHVQLETTEAESKARLRKDMLHHSIHMLLFVWQSHHWNTANNGTKLSKTLNYRYDDTAIENCDISHPVNDVNCRHPCISKGEKFDQANLPPHLTNFCAHLNQSHLARAALRTWPGGYVGHLNQLVASCACIYVCVDFVICFGQLHDSPAKTHGTSGGLSVTCKLPNNYMYSAELRTTSTLQWRHNEHDGVSNHQPHDCLLDLLFKRR